MISRRFFLFGAPAIVAASSLMPISVWNLGYDRAAVNAAMIEVMGLRDAHGWPLMRVGVDHPAHPVKRGLITLRDFRLDIASPWQESGRGYGVKVDDDLRPVENGNWNKFQDEIGVMSGDDAEWSRAALSDEIPSAVTAGAAYVGHSRTREKNPAFTGSEYRDLWDELRPKLAWRLS